MPCIDHPSFERWFLARVNKTPRCWVWRGSTNDSGYGRVWDDTYRKTFRAHRLAYAMWVGPITPHDVICHTCGNRLCVNPDHLYAGTAEQNVLDMLEDGTKHGQRLKPPQVLAIRASTDAPLDLALTYNVSLSTIRDIQSGRTWQHI